MIPFFGALLGHRTGAKAATNNAPRDSQSPSVATAPTDGIQGSYTDSTTSTTPGAYATSTIPPMSTVNGTVCPRSMLRPIPHQNRRFASRPLCGPSADIAMEEDESALPEGYVGTYGTIQYYQPKTPDIAFPCGTNGHHQLACGHWVLDTSKLGEAAAPCGLNCIKPSFDTTPFHCAQCARIVEDIYLHQLTDDEHQKITAAQQAGEHAFVIAYLTEFVGKRMPLNGGLTETIMGSVRDGYTRACVEASPPEPIKYMTPAEMWGEIEKRKRREAFMKNNRLVGGRKRVPLVAPSTAYKPKKVALAPPVSFATPRWEATAGNFVGPIIRQRRAEDEEVTVPCKRVKRSP